MTETGAKTANTAETGAQVGIMADEVHNSQVNMYTVLPEAPPERKYEVGVRMLDDGMPLRARALIGEAIAHGHDNAEVRFHWVLAMLSKRAYRDLTHDERAALDRIPEYLRAYPDDEWKRALNAMRVLLASLNDPGGDPGPAVAELRGLPPAQWAMINRHLDLVLTGGVKDSLWAERRQAADDGQFSGNRVGRVWAYFQPDPAGPRARPPAPADVTPAHLFRAVGWSVVFAAAAGYVGWLVIKGGLPLPIVAYVAIIVAGVVAARTGLEWRYRSERLLTKELECFGQRGVYWAPEGGFANKVDDSFKHYFAKYTPAGTQRERWLSETSGIRDTLRAEIAEIYRESTTKVGEVKWLIRFLVWDVAKRWRAGTLTSYREKYRITPATKTWCVLAVTLLIAAVPVMLIPTVTADPLHAAFAAFAALVTAPSATSRWMHIVSERRRAIDDEEEYARTLELRGAAFRRWKDKLERLRPTESEMEFWLDCDRVMLVDEVLRLYRLAWRDVIAHAFLQTPAPPYKRARVPGGPLRYSRYDIRLFLITQDGVREVNTELDFENVEHQGQERNNYRFDAVSSVHVTKRGESSHTLELTLMNGPTRNIRVMEPVTRTDESEENAATFARTNLDAAGFTHTLHILEGIAAEGKGWINRDPHANGKPRAEHAATDGAG